MSHVSEKGSRCHYKTLLSPSHHYSSWSDNIVVQGLVSKSHKASYCKNSQSHEAAILVFRIARLLWNLTDTSAALLPKHPSNFKAMWRLKLPISWLRVFTRSYNNASDQILKRNPDRPLFKQSFTPRSTSDTRLSSWPWPWCEGIVIQYIPRNMHAVFALLCFVVVIHWLIFPYLSGLLHWHCGNLTIAPVPAKQPWWIWINTSCEFIMNDCITTTKQSTTKPCAYFLGYTVHQTPDLALDPGPGARELLYLSRGEPNTWINASTMKFLYILTKILSGGFPSHRTSSAESVSTL